MYTVQLFCTEYNQTFTKTTHVTGKCEYSLAEQISEFVIFNIDNHVLIDHKIMLFFSPIIYNFIKSC